MDGLDERHPGPEGVVGERPSPPGSVAVTSITAVPTLAAVTVTCPPAARAVATPPPPSCRSARRRRSRRTPVTRARRASAPAPACGRAGCPRRPAAGWPGRIPPRGGHRARGVEDGHRVGRAGHARDAGAESDAHGSPSYRWRGFEKRSRCQQRTPASSHHVEWDNYRAPPAGRRGPRLERPWVQVAVGRMREHVALVVVHLVAVVREPHVVPQLVGEGPAALVVGGMLKAWRMPASPPY